MKPGSDNIEIPILLYEDPALVIVNKPPGLLSIPDGYDPNLPYLRQILEPIYGDLWMVHRLDKDTSGAVILARNADAHRSLNAMFRERNVAKTYHALVTPVPDWRDKVIELPLKTDADRQHRTRVDHANGKEAHSICEVLKRYNFGVLMAVRILTGITHQVRAHLRALDLAILGDTLYNAGLPKQPFDVLRTMLHARSLAFDHPLNGQLISVTAPYPDDFRDAYTKLRTTTAPDAGF